MVNVKPVTLYDVAEYAGVSYQTVSRVVNQASHVSAKTREKVEAAMAELNYIHHPELTLFRALSCHTAKGFAPFDGVNVNARRFAVRLPE